MRGLDLGDSSVIFKIYIHPFKLREMENSKIEVKEEKEKKEWQNKEGSRWLLDPSRYASIYSCNEWIQ